MRKAVLVVIFWMLCVINLNAQDTYVDSMKQVIRHASNDATRVSLQIQLAWYYFYNLSAEQGDSSILILENASRIAQEKNLYHEEVEALYWRALFIYGAGLYKLKLMPAISEALSLARQRGLKDLETDLLCLSSMSMTNNRDSAIRLADEALSIATHNKLTEQLANALYVKGTLFTLTNPDSARRMFSKSLSIAERLPSRLTEFTLLRMIAHSWSLAHLPDTSMYYMQRALQLSRANNMVNETLLVLPLFIRSQTGYFLLDSLNNYYRQLLSLCRQHGRDSLQFMFAYAQTSQNIGNYSSALRTDLQMLHICEERRDTALTQSTLYSIGLSYEYSLDYTNAIKYLNKARSLGKKDGYIYVFTYDDLARCYLKLQQYDSARIYAAKCYQVAAEYFGSEASIFGGILNDLGVTYFELGEDSLALNYLRRSYQEFTVKRVEYKNYALTTEALANYFTKHGPADSVLYYARLCLNVARDKGFLENITRASDLIARFYHNKGNADSAYYYQAIGFDAYKKLYNYESSREFQNLAFAEQQREEEVALAKKMAAEKYASNLKLYGLLTALLVAIIIGFIIYRNNRQRQRSYELLKKQKLEIDQQKSRLEESLKSLQSTQAQLVQSEKMASLGELTAGIAHEIQNPLNFVNNFSDLNKELIAELKEELKAGNLEEVEAIANDIGTNEDKINHHGKRAESIVTGMLQHSRTSTGQKEPTDINKLADEYLRLAYHGIRAKDKDFNCEIVTAFDETLGKIHIIPQDIGRVILNLVNNAFYAVNEKNKSNKDGYKPSVSLTTKLIGDKVQLSVADNGNGIPKKIIDKIFNPFFTTKPTGQGTGLGLSLSYDIVKAHGGEIKVDSKEGEGTAFIIVLPC